MDSYTRGRLRRVLSKLKRVYSADYAKERAFLKHNKKIEDIEIEPEEETESKPLEKKEKIEEQDDEENVILRFGFPVNSKEPALAQNLMLEKIRKTKDSYPIVMANYLGKKIPVAKANIYYDTAIHSLRYDLVEPMITAEEADKIGKTLQILQDRLDVNLNTLKNREGIYHYLDQKVNEIWKVMHFNPTDIQSIKMKYFIFRNTIGFDKIDALMQDPNIEDISCDGIGLPIYIFHRNPSYGEIPTNISFNSKDALDKFVMKLAQKCNRTISVAAPLMDGTLEDGSRVQITYGTDIARRGSNFTIRKFFKIPLTPIDLINFNTIDPMMLAYLWLAIENQYSILIAGGTATGKTTLLNALSLFIEPNLKIVSIEDTAELRLPHINWMPQVARAGFGPNKYGEISLYDLLRAALRQRPDYLIVGEVRGKEASVLFQAMSTGHPGLSTLHADSVHAIIDRLTNRPINLPAAVLQNLDLFVFISRVKKNNKITRRVSKIIEVESYDPKTESLITNEVFSWKSANDEFVSKRSSLLKKISEKYGWTQKQISDELLRRMHILTWMLNSEIYHFDDVSKVIKMYYTNPQGLYKLMNNG